MTVPVLLIATLLFRVLGALGVRRFATWTVSATHGLAVMLVMTASAHFVPATVTVMPNHADLVAMVPPFVPFASAVIYLTGVLELAGALGLVLGKTRQLAAYCLIALFVVLLPGNIYAAVADVQFAGEAPTPLWIRIPEQVLYIAVAALAARSRSKSVEPQVSRQTLAKV